MGFAAFFSSMIFSENRYPLFGIMLKRLNPSYNAGDHGRFLP
jgi:hypothetical protein